MFRIVLHEKHMGNDITHGKRFERLFWFILIMYVARILISTVDSSFMHLANHVFKIIIYVAIQSVTLESNSVF